MPKQLSKIWATGFYLGFVLILTMAICGVAIGAFAGGCVATAPNSCTNTHVTVDAGPLSESQPGTVTLSPVTMNGIAAQTTTYTLPVTVTNATGSGAGWKLTITSTAFSAGFAGGPPRLGNHASTVTGITVSCTPGDTCTSNHIAYPVPVPAGATAPTTANTFFSTPVNTGMGTFLVTPMVTVTVPANAFTGIYASVVTVAVVSGP